MIVNKDKAISYIASWLKEYVTKNGKDTLAINITFPNLENILLAEICKKTNIKTILLPTLHFYYEWNEDTDSTFLNFYNTYLPKLGLEYEKALNHIEIFDEVQERNGVILHSINRNKNHLIRHYNKHLDFVDLKPFADLFKSEIDQLCEYKDLTHLIDDLNLELDASIDGINYSELEWVDRENMKNGIIFSPNDPVKHKNYYLYTGRQKEVICKVHQIEKRTLHKKNESIPVCYFRDSSGLEINGLVV